MILCLGLRTIPCPNFLPLKNSTPLPKAKAKARPEMKTDVLVIGAGPTGLACAIEAQKIGLKVVVLDKGCLVNSLFHYPANMTFFTTPELLEIGDIPFTTALQKPTREEALEYYRKVAEHYHARCPAIRVGEDGDGRRRKFQHHRDRPRGPAARLQDRRR